MTEQEYQERCREIRAHYHDRWDALDEFKAGLNDYIRILEKTGVVKTNPERYKEAENIREMLSNHISHLWALRDMELAKLEENYEKV